MANRWSRKTTINDNNTAPTTIFTNGLSPRQIANKALTLGYKKLNRDAKRPHPQYNFRIQVLISNTIAKAETVLNQRTRRTNRRVMAAEEEEEEDYLFDLKNRHHSKAQQQQEQNNDPTTNGSILNHDLHQQSPLRSCSSKDQRQSTISSSLSSSSVTTTSLSTIRKNDMGDHQKKEKSQYNHDLYDKDADPMTGPSCHNHSTSSIVVSPSSASSSTSPIPRDCKPIVIQSVTAPSIESII
ncbi:hypothetical protein BDA99DRAFT_502059 [Phascolomyces articulosus]|uniref:Uncharacterized protein n=1 Tax=Phascolomyces articulosus TaxID=60185 RepID=A0AAD5KGM3_9FUNG|nr:hypothetical protein BDA99DRAFT_502059 [Phascolomyces articulosus]